MNKVIVLDSGVLTHKAIFGWGNEKKKRLLEGNEDDPIVASYTYLNMCFSILKKIGIDSNDIIIIAQDARNSWRKAFLEVYKGQRQGLRDANAHIDWTLQYTLINKLEDQLDQTTNWHFIKLENIFNYADLVLSNEGQKLDIEKHGSLPYDKEFGIESDDIQCICPKFFPDKEVVLVTIDEDLSQVVYYENCKIFNPYQKSPTNKTQKGFYKIIDNPLKIITKKVASGDASDNILIDKVNDTERDVEVRELIINLIKIPDFVEQPIIKALEGLDYTKKVIYEELPFQNSLAQRFDSIYDQSGIRTWEESVKKHLKRLEKQAESKKRSADKQKAKRKALKKKVKV